MPIKFLVDFMLGKLARELRIIGFDVQYIRPPDIKNKSPLTVINLLKQQERIILTRNTKLKGYSDVVFITSEKPNEQIEQVIKQFNLKKEIKPFNRCLVCNEILISVAKDEVKGRVPFYIFQTKNEFSCCPRCQKIYWQGTHLKDMKKRVRKLQKRQN